VPFLSVWLLASIGALAFGPAVTAERRDNSGRIQGTVRLTAAPAAVIPSGVYGSRRVTQPRPTGAELGNVVVFLSEVGTSADLPVMRATMVQKDEVFQPRVLAITRGSTVAFPNSDPFFHNVFSLSPNATFDLGRYPRGDNRSRTFAHPGLVKLYCHIHSHMSAAIMVFDHPYFAMPAADGTFTIDDVPPGTYQISAWHERIGENRRPVRLEAGRTAKVDFTLPVAER
jgi:plastocyanin